MVELTDEEAREVVSVVENVRSRHFDGSPITGDKLHRLHNELEGRLNDLGYKVTVDVTPLLRSSPPTITLDERLDRFDMDIERKLHDIAKRVERNEEAPDIEGFV